MADPITGFFNSAGGAVSELFAASSSKTKADMFRLDAKGDLLKGEGARLEGESYKRASTLALQNEEFTKQSVAIQEAQAGRQIYKAEGSIRAGYGAAGLRESGSALDVLADSARQGEVEKQVLGQQGLITEAGYQEQSDVYQNMVKASQVAVEGAELASQEHLMAADAEDKAAIGHDISAAIKGVSAIFSLGTMFAAGGGG